MRIRLVAVGKRMPGWIDAGYAEYSKRFPPELPLQLHEVSGARRGRNTSPERLRRDEAENILRVLGRDDYVIALDERGRQLDTRRLARTMQTWQREGRNISFVIGGPDGLHESITGKADEIWSLSGCTLPHGLVRVLLAEQLYRAWTLMTGHPYHRK